MENSTTSFVASDRQQEHYRNQIRQIKQLTDHYTTFNGSKTKMAEKNLGKTKREMCAEANEKEKKENVLNRCKCGLCCLNCQNTSTMNSKYGLADGKTREEFTPAGIEKRCTSVTGGDNQGSNYRKQPLWPKKPLDTVISIINMPSQSQGQVFIPSPCRQHNRDTSRPVSRYRPSTAQSERQQQKVTGWKRDVRSATMYTRYRNPELFSLIYSDLKSETVSSLEISSLHEDPGKKYTRLG